MVSPSLYCVGLTSGCFDLLHFYHLQYLEKCKAKCDWLIVGVDSDEMIKENKGKEPCVPEHHRVAMVEALKCVDAAFLMRSLDDFKRVASSAHRIFKNSSQIYGKPMVCGAEKLIVVPDVEELLSTSAIMTKIRNIHARRPDEEG